MQKLKIAQITPYYYPSIGGVAGVVQYISEELVKLGHSVDVVTVRRDHKGRKKLNAPKFEIINGVNVYRYKSVLNIGHMSLFPALFTHLLFNKYDIIHYHSYRHPLCDISSLISRLKGNVCILHGHGPFFEPGEIQWKKQKVYDFYDKIALKTVLKWSSCIIALNNYEKQRYIKIGVPNKKIIVIPNAASKENFEYVDSSPFIKKFGLQNKKIILFVGILNKFKRPDLLILALEKIIKSVPDAHLVLAGPDGGMLNIVQNLAKELKLDKYFTWVGPLYGSEKQMGYCASSIFALPSDWEGYPLVLLEALAHSLPVVTTDIRGSNEIIKDGTNGFLVPKGNFELMAEKSIKLLLNENLYNEMRNNSKMIAINNFKADLITKKIEKIYYQLLQ